MTLTITRWLFLIMVVSLPVVRPFDVNLFGLRTALADFLFLAVFLFTAISIFQRHLLPKLANFHCLVGLYVMSLGISLCVSDNLKLSVGKLSALLYLAAIGSVSYLLVQSDPKFLRRIAFAWSVGTIITIFAGALGFIFFYLGYKTPGDNFLLSHFGSLPAGNYPRIHALFANANMMTNYLNVSLVMAFLLGDLNLISRAKTRVLIGGIWLSAIFTFSAGLGGLVLSTGVRGYSRLANTGRKRLARSFLISAAALSLSIFASTLVSPDTPNTDQYIPIPALDRVVEPSVRVLVWQSAVQTIEEFPILGKGVGIDPVRVRYTTLSGDTQILRDAHNNWLNVGGQAGLVGLIGFTSLTFYLLWICAFRLKVVSEHSTSLFLLSCGLAGAFFFQGFTGSFEDARHLWILFGIIAAIAGGGTDTEKESLQP